MKKKVLFNIIASFILAAFATGFSFMFPQIYFRLWQVLKEFGISCAFWVEQTINNMFGAELGWNIQAIINESNYIDGFSIGFLPESWDEFLFHAKVFFENFIIKDFWIDYFRDAAKNFLYFSRILFFIVPLGIPLYFICRNYFSYSEENGVGVYSRQLLRWNKFLNKVDNFKKLVKEFWNYSISKWYYLYSALIAFAFFTNIITIFISFVGYYLYFSCSFNFLSLWSQVVRLYYDISFMFRPVYIPFWIGLFYFLLKKICLSIANSRKQRALNVAYNFVKNIMGLMTLIVGTMGKGKTRMMSYVSLINEDYFKQEALDRMKKYSSYFPKEDWRTFETKIDEAFSKHEIYNLATCRKWLSKNLSEDFKNISFYDGSGTKTLYNCYFTYGQLYFIYLSPTSFIISNYGVRSGLFQTDSIHLTEFVNDFMGSDEEYYTNSNFAHICDDNNYRLLNTVDNRLEWAKAIDIGIVLKDEVGKDRKNQVESVDIKKDDPEANQKNDGFNLALKLGRHPSTVDNFPFWRFISAEQRADSVPADFRELNDCIVDIKEKSQEKNLFPFFPFIEWCADIVLSFVDNLFFKYRFNRDENTLIFQFIKDIQSKINKYKKYMSNMYGVEISPVNLLDGSKTEERNVIRSIDFPMLNSLIYSSRFKTDAYADVFNERGLESEYGLNDIPCFESERATVAELELTNQYFIRDLLNAKEGKLKVKTYKKGINKNTKYRRY